MCDRPAAASVADLHKTVTRVNVVFFGAGGGHGWGTVNIWRRVAATLPGGLRRDVRRTTGCILCITDYQWPPRISIVGKFYPYFIAGQKW
ncbi:hypothetical protein ECD227_4089 (plasmid) [Escherichia fergusonii ECD227]|nr:hypothetical protein ECD227_4089 [Escherichia fergusonii ECD227]